MASVSVGATALMFSAWCGLVSAAMSEEVVKTISPRTLSGILAKAGILAKVTVTGGDATLVLEQPPELKLPVEVFFYECDGGAFAAPAKPDSACLSYEYRAYAPFPQTGEDSELANRWNETYHFGKAWRDELGDISLQMNFMVAGGVSERNFIEAYQRWKLTLTAFTEYLEIE